ncbi:hypothetical protein AAFF_G00317420 [Aldrovandia affinis]|uniref:Uncharacterized protein n=1 Tax=Aldrovandia affinis TaxID=143900 RepID=A0AAD7W0A8_9TELE|nr:hypothetical protein AAFF_G00317420 [Aldrovandia affinis]
MSAALHLCILALRSRSEQEVETKSAPPEPDVPQSNEEDSDEDVLAPTTALASELSEPADPQHTGST